VVNKSSADRSLVALSVYRDDTSKHSGNKYYDNNKKEHKVVVKINDFFHDFRCWGLEINLSGRSRIKHEERQSAFCYFTTERAAVFNTRRIDTSGITLSYWVLNGEHI